MFLSEMNRYVVRLGCSLSGLALGLTAPALAQSENFRLVPSQFDSVEVIEVPLRAAVPAGEWRPSSGAKSYLASPIVSDQEEALRVTGYWPLGLDEEGRESSALQRKVSLDAAALFEAAGDWNAARYAYLRAIELGGDDFDTWRALAHVAMQSRDPVLAEAAQLSALESLRESTDALELVERRARVHRDLATLYMLEGRSADAARVLQRVEGLDEPGPVVRVWLDRFRLPVAFAPSYFTFSPSLAWPEESPLSLDGQLVAWADQAHDSLPSWMKKKMAEATAWVRVGSRMSTIVTVGLSLMALLLLLRLIRQRGDLIVTVEYPEELRGTFRIRVGTSKNEKPRLRATRGPRFSKGVPRRGMSGTWSIGKPSSIACFRDATGCLSKACFSIRRAMRFWRMFPTAKWFVFVTAGL